MPYDDLLLTTERKFLYGYKNAEVSCIIKILLMNRSNVVWAAMNLYTSLVMELFMQTNDI